MQIHLGEKIRTLRQRDGRTQEMLATAIGVTPQAVSRWEAESSYPDVENIPAIADFFGISIDALFGYDDKRDRQIATLVEQIENMNRRNNGVDVSMDECIALARRAVVQFPGSVRLRVALAQVLFNAGYVRYAEHHLFDTEGYDVYDVERHRTYAEWTEAIALYESVLPELPAGSMRWDTIGELTQLYLNMGEHQKALAVVAELPDIHRSGDLLKINAVDGKERAAAYSEGVLKTGRACAELLVGATLTYETNLTPGEKVQALQAALHVMDTICSDGNCGIHGRFLAHVDTLLSVYLWLDGKHDDAFAALDDAFRRYRLYQKNCAGDSFRYTTPHLKLVTEDTAGILPDTDGAISLAEDWPWWSVHEYEQVKREIQADERWAKWVERLRHNESYVTEA